MRLYPLVRKRGNVRADLHTYLCSPKGGLSELDEPLKKLLEQRFEFL